jgi:hypothetical protein
MMINSLRLSGNRGEVVVVDGGMTPLQRAQLAGVATIVDPPSEVAGTHALAVKPSVYLLEPKGVVVLVDSDMIVTRKLDDLVDRALDGQIVVFPDHRSKHDRWFAEWKELFELAAEPRRQVYVNAGLVALSVERWPEFLQRWYRATRRIPPERIQQDPSDAAWAADQDALNAILMSEVAAEDLWIGPSWESVHPDGLREVEIVDERTLECRYEGKQTTVLHFSLYPKPWSPNGWRRITRDNAFVKLMPRVLFGPDLAIRTDEKKLPFWARAGAGAKTASSALGATVSAGYGAKRAGLRVREALRRVVA